MAKGRALLSYFAVGPPSQQGMADAIKRTPKTGALPEDKTESGVVPETDDPRQIINHGPMDHLMFLGVALQTLGSGTLQEGRRWTSMYLK
jgi:hypothetical protein